MHVKGVEARKAEKTRIKQLKELQKNINIIPDEMFQPIVDPEAAWKATDATWLAQQEAKKQGKKPRLEAPNEDDDEELDIIVNQPKSSWMEEDFVDFEDSGDENAGGDAGHSGHAEQLEHAIDDEFFPGDFFDEWDDDDDALPTMFK